MLGHSDLINDIERVFTWDALYLGHVQQAVAAAAISGPQDWIFDEIALYPDKRDLVLSGLRWIDQTKPHVPSAGVFIYVDTSELKVSGQALEDLLLDVGVPAVSGRYFRGPEHHLRLVFGALFDVLDAMLEALRQALAPFSNARVRLGPGLCAISESGRSAVGST